jgi:hypothetical protein
MTGHSAGVLYCFICLFEAKGLVLGRQQYTGQASSTSM